jgi:hypothetical protein
MKRLFLAATAALIASSALAQTYRDSTGTLVPGFVPVGGDGSGALFTGGNPGHVSGTFSASLGGFQPAASYSQLAVSASSARVALPIGVTVVVYNTGSNDAFVTLGNSLVTATIGSDVVKAGGWMAFAVPAGATNIAAITSSGATTLNLSGGAGLPTGSAGTGAGGGGGGTVAQGSAGSASSAWFVQAGAGATFPSTQSGVWSVNLGTLNGAATAANQAAAQGSISGGVAAANSEAIGGVFNTSLPTLTNGQQAAEQLDSSGRQLVNLGAGVNIGATGSSVPASAVLSGANSSGNLTAIIQADHSTPINIATATTTQLVASSGSTKIYVTSFGVIAGGTGNITLEYGTGTNCGTGATTLTGAYSLTAQAGISQGSGLGPILVVPAGNALCAITSAAVQMSGSVAYTQF